MSLFGEKVINTALKISRLAAIVQILLRLGRKRVLLKIFSSPPALSYVRHLSGWEVLSASSLFCESSRLSDSAGCFKPLLLSTNFAVFIKFGLRINSAAAIMTNESISKAVTEIQISGKTVHGNSEKSMLSMALTARYTDKDIEHPVKTLSAKIFVPQAAVNFRISFIIID